MTQKPVRSREERAPRVMRIGSTAIKQALKLLQAKGLVSAKEVSQKIGIFWEVPSFLIDDAMLNKTLSDRVDARPGQIATGSESDSASLAGRNPSTYKDLEKEPILENTLKAYFLHLQPRRRREREQGYFEQLKREYSVEDIGDVLRTVRASRTKRVQAEQEELAKVVQAAQALETDKREAEEFERKSAKFLHVFPDAKSQDEIVGEYCKKTPWVPKGNVARRLVIQDWWERLYGDECQVEAAIGQ